MQDNTAQSFYNAMELLVAEEVKKQYETCPESLREYINPVEVATFALNRLPSLYASCKEGMRRQQTRGKIRYSKQISDAVRQGFAAVQRDPLRRSTPLEPESRNITKAAASKDLGHSLDQEKSLEDVVRFLEETLAKSPNHQTTQKRLNQLLSELDYGWRDSRYL